MMSRREVLASAGALLVARELHAATPPKESGLSSEGLLAGRQGFQPRTVMPLPHDELPGFLSRAQLASHHAEYVGDVEALKDVEEKLRAGAAAGYGDLRRRQVATANAVLLHELYFGGLSTTSVAPSGYIGRHMAEHVGSFDTWRDDFTRCALAAKAWALLVYDPYDDRWHDVVMDSDTDGAWIGANPLVVCDVAAHAFGTDYSSREAYVAKFLDHVDWDEVAKRYKAVDRM